jgi:hypothetical protein
MTDFVASPSILHVVTGSTRPMVQRACRQAIFLVGFCMWRQIAFEKIMNIISKRQFPRMNDLFCDATRKIPRRERMGSGNL